MPFFSEEQVFAAVFSKLLPNYFLLTFAPFSKEQLSAVTKRFSAQLSAYFVCLFG